MGIHGVTIWVMGVIKHLLSLSDPPSIGSIHHVHDCYVR